MTKRASLCEELATGAADAWTLYVGAGVSATRTFEAISMTTDERATNRSNWISRARWAFVSFGLVPVAVFLDDDLGFGLNVDMKTEEAMRMGEIHYARVQTHGGERAEGRPLVSLQGKIYNN